jgi:hypothetical protein
MDLGQADKLWFIRIGWVEITTTPPRVATKHVETKDYLWKWCSFFPCGHCFVNRHQVLDWESKARFLSIRSTFLRIQDCKSRSHTVIWDVCEPQTTGCGPWIESPEVDISSHDSLVCVLVKPFGFAPHLQRPCQLIPRFLCIPRIQHEPNEMGQNKVSFLLGMTISSVSVWFWDCGMAWHGMVCILPADSLLPPSVARSLCI